MICVVTFSDNWVQYGSEGHEYFDKNMRPEIALFQTEHYSRLKYIEELQQCKLCYSVTKPSSVDYSRRDILEQVNVRFTIHKT